MARPARVQRTLPAAKLGRWSVAGLVAGAVVACTPAAWAGSFFDDGSFAFDPNAVATFDFEHGVPEPTDPEEEPIERVESKSALSGRWVIDVDKLGQAYIPLDLPPTVRRYRVSLWIRGGGATGTRARRTRIIKHFTKTTYTTVTSHWQPCCFRRTGRPNWR